MMSSPKQNQMLKSIWFCFMIRDRIGSCALFVLDTDPNRPVRQMYLGLLDSQFDAALVERGGDDDDVWSVSWPDLL